MSDLTVSDTPQCPSCGPLGDVGLETHYDTDLDMLLTGLFCWKCKRAGVYCKTATEAVASWNRGEHTS
jgi:hypothetical protein